MNLSDSSSNISSSIIKMTQNDFQMLKVIGKGSYSTVYLVKHKNYDKIYAMKVIKKELIKEKNIEQKCLGERNILIKATNPFIVNLHYTFQSDTKLYYIMDFCSGGELFYHLKKKGIYNEKTAQFYAAELIIALEYLHSLGIVYRDLKPENVLIDIDGHIKLADFGLSKCIKNKKPTFSFCGTPDYLAPEIIKGEGHDKSVDWWSLGVVIYEMLSGKTPHYQEDKRQLLQDIVERPINLKHIQKSEIRSLLNGLLQRNPQKRLGYSKQDAQEIKNHPWFKNIQWVKFYSKTISPPFIPQIDSPEDTSNISAQFTEEPIKETPLKNNINMSDQNHLDQFTYTTPSNQLQIIYE